MLHTLTPYSPTKQLAEAYNTAMSLIPEGDTACLIDYDVQFLLPDTIARIEEYSELYPNFVLTCYTNRIHHLSPQLLNGKISDVYDIKFHIGIAEGLRSNNFDTFRIGIMSGFLMVIPKKVWQKIPFRGEGCLGIDSNFRDDLTKAGIPILLMTSVYVFHQYRLINGVGDKRHLI